MKVPKSALLFKNTDEGSVEIFAEGDSQEKNRFRLVGNSGKPFGSGFFGKMIIDFENLKLRKSPLVTLREHNPLLVAGTSRRTKNADELVFEGKFSKVTETANEIKELLSEGVKFESSVRVEPKTIDFIDEKEEAEVNGQTVKGPMRIFRDNLVSEVSFVLFGADKKTSGKLVAAENEETIDITERKEFIMTENSSSQITEAQLADAQKAAMKEEQQRIMSITTELAGAELAEVRTKAIKDNLSLADAKALAFEVVKKAKDTQLSQKDTELNAAQQKLDAIAAGGTDLLGQTDAEANAEASKGELKSDNPDLYFNEFNRLLDLDKSGSDAVKLAAKRYPESHAAWIEAQPTTTKGALPRI